MPRCSSRRSRWTAIRSSEGSGGISDRRVDVFAQPHPVREDLGEDDDPEAAQQRRRRETRRRAVAGQGCSAVPTPRGRTARAARPATRSARSRRAMTPRMSRPPMTRSRWTLAPTNGSPSRTERAIPRRSHSTAIQSASGSRSMPRARRCSRALGILDRDARSLLARRVEAIRDERLVERRHRFEADVVAVGGDRIDGHEHGEHDREQEQHGRQAMGDRGGVGRAVGFHVGHLHIDTRCYRETIRSIIDMSSPGREIRSLDRLYPWGVY